MKTEYYVIDLEDANSPVLGRGNSEDKAIYDAACFLKDSTDFDYWLDEQALTRDFRRDVDGNIPCEDIEDFCIEFVEGLIAKGELTVAKGTPKGRTSLPVVILAVLSSLLISCTEVKVIKEEAEEVEVDVDVDVDDNHPELEYITVYHSSSFLPHEIACPIGWKYTRVEKIPDELGIFQHSSPAVYTPDSISLSRHGTLLICEREIASELGVGRDAFEEQTIYYHLRFCADVPTCPIGYEFEEVIDSDHSNYSRHQSNLIECDAHGALICAKNFVGSIAYLYLR